jgi:hypothetical protein
MKKGVIFFLVGMLLIAGIIGPVSGLTVVKKTNKSPIKGDILCVGGIAQEPHDIRQGV